MFLAFVAQKKKILRLDFGCRNLLILRGILGSTNGIFVYLNWNPTDLIKATSQICALFDIEVGRNYEFINENYSGIIYNIQDENNSSKMLSFSKIFKIWRAIIKLKEWNKLKCKFAKKLTNFRWRCRLQKKKSLAQEVRQKSDISEHRSKGWG